MSRRPKVPDGFAYNEVRDAQRLGPQIAPETNTPELAEASLHIAC